MNVPFHCSKCGARFLSEYNDENEYTFICECGQKTAFCLGVEKFEILFSFGCSAYLSGFYREAVANFAASLERFFEYYVYVVSKRRHVGTEQFGGLWKLLNSQSERQLGAFAMLFTIENDQYPDFISAKNIGSEFRNNIIHRGKIPTKNETNEYAEKIYRIIKQVFFSITEDSSEFIMSRILDKMNHLNQKYTALGYHVSSIHFDTMFHVAGFREGDVSEEKHKSFVEYVNTDKDFLSALSKRVNYIREMYSQN